MLTSNTSLYEIVEEIGEKLVIQVITDNVANYRRADELLVEREKLCGGHHVLLILEMYTLQIIS